MFFAYLIPITDPHCMCNHVDIKRNYLQVKMNKLNLTEPKWVGDFQNKFLYKIDDFKRHISTLLGPKNRYRCHALITFLIESLFVRITHTEKVTLTKINKKYTKILIQVTLFRCNLIYCFLVTRQTILYTLSWSSGLTLRLNLGRGVMDTRVEI